MAALEITGHTLNLPQLAAELATAGIQVAGLGTSGVDPHGKEYLFTYDASGQQIDLPTAAAAIVNAHVPSTALRDAIATAVQSSVGVTLGNLTQAQAVALVKALLVKIGAVDPQTLAIRPLNQWLT